MELSIIHRPSHGAYLRVHTQTIPFLYDVRLDYVSIRANSIQLVFVTYDRKLGYADIKEDESRDGLYERKCKLKAVRFGW
jgi:hypothetical protein